MDLHSIFILIDPGCLAPRQTLGRVRVLILGSRSPQGLFYSAPRFNHRKATGSGRNLLLTNALTSRLRITKLTRPILNWSTQVGWWTYLIRVTTIHNSEINLDNVCNCGIPKGTNVIMSMNNLRDSATNGKCKKFIFNGNRLFLVLYRPELFLGNVWLRRMLKRWPALYANRVMPIWRRIISNSDQFCCAKSNTCYSKRAQIWLSANGLMEKQLIFY